MSAPRSWFIANPDYDGPPIELTCGRHTKDGRFIPKNVKLTPGISRLSRSPRRRIPMVGDSSQDVREIYRTHMAQKRRSASSSDPLIGRVIRMDTPCQCGSDTAIIRPGKGPHLGALHCQSCGVHRKWISRESFVAIGKVVAAVVAQVGIEPAEITFRNPPKKEGCETSPADAHDLRRAGDDSLDRPIRATATTGRVRFFPRENKQTAQPNEPVPFDDPIPGF